MSVKAKWGVSRKDAPCVFDWGAKGDGVSDDTVALNGYAEECGRNGWTFRLGFPHRVTAPVKFAPSLWTDFAPFVGREYGLSNRNDYLNSTNVTAAQAYAGCDIVGEPGGVIIADFTGDATPVVEYNCLPIGRRHRVRDLAVCSVNYVTSDKLPGVYNNSIPSNGLIGFVQANPNLSDVDGCVLSGLQHIGGLAIIPYWTRWRNSRAFACGEGFAFLGMNAGGWDNLSAFYCNRGIVAGGTGLNSGSASFQQCRTELRFIGGDNVFIGGGYYEDINAGLDGTGYYAVDIGWMKQNLTVADTSDFVVDEVLTGSVTGATAYLQSKDEENDVLSVFLTTSTLFSTSDTVSGAAGSESVSVASALQTVMAQGKINGIYVGTQRPNKGAYRARGVSASFEFEACRNGAKAVSTDGTIGPPTLTRCEWSIWS